MQSYSLTRTSAPAANALEAATVYEHLRLPLSGSPPAPDDEALVLAYRDAVEAHLDGADGVLGRALVTQTWEMTMRHFPLGCDRIHGDLRIRLSLPPLQSVASITYVDADGATQTLDASKYTVVTGERGAIVPAYGETWPTTRDVPEAVTVTFVAGYGDAADDVPGAIRAAGLIMVADLYDARTDIVTGTTVNRTEAVDRLLNPYRVVF